VGTLGGIGLAVSRFSTHPREAIELVRYLTRKDVEMKRSQLLSGLATGPELNQQLRDSGKDSNFSAVIEEFSTSVVSRPSNITGSKYESVGSAYAHAVHSVLTGKRGAQEAAAGLERDLVRLTGFKTGPPELEPPHR
jgi:trehalose/maltose transport system substrate-binding protein